MKRLITGATGLVGKEIVKKGANKIDFLNDSRYRLPSGWAPKFNSGIITFTCTRTLLENTIRNQILKISKNFRALIKCLVLQKY